MKAVIIKAFGAADGLSVVDLPKPVPGPTEVLIAVDAIGVGGVDALIRNGSLAGWGFTEGLVPGSEVAGTVESVGREVDESGIGRRVWGFTGLGGGYADHATAEIDHVVPLPDDLSAVDAVTLGSSGVVAHFALEHVHFQPDESVLVRGAAGSIGILTVQLAARRGASAVAVTTSSAKRGEQLRRLGATHVLDRSGAGDGPPAYDVIVDVVAGPDLPTYFGKLKPNGRLVVVGIVGGQPPADFGTTLMAAFRSSLTFSTFSADTVPAEQRRTVRAEQFAAAARGELPTVVHEQLALDDAVVAHQKIDAGEVFGRIVLIP